MPVDRNLLSRFLAPGSISCLSFELSPLLPHLKVELNPTVPDKEGCMEMSASSPCSHTGSLLSFLLQLFALKSISPGTFWVTAPWSRACRSACRPCTLQLQMCFLALGCAGITSGWVVTTWLLSNPPSLHTSDSCVLTTCHAEKSNASSAFVYCINSHLVHSLQKDVCVT